MITRRYTNSHADSVIIIARSALCNLLISL